jgi:ribonuclease HI
MVQYIRSYAEEFSVLKRQKPELVQAGPKPRWCRPPNGVVKLNCDGAFSQSSRSGGWGFILRDHEGNVIGSGFGKLAKVLEPAHTEIIACLQAVQSAADLGIQNIILESDAAAVVNAVLSMEMDRSSAYFGN